MTPALAWEKVLPATPELLSQTQEAWQFPGVINETNPRMGAGAANAAAPTASGTLYLAGGIVLPAGVPVGFIEFHSGSTAMVTPTNQWFCLINRDTLAPLAVTVDDLATAWAANAAKRLALSAVYTPSVDTSVYLGICVVAAAVPSTRGAQVSISIASAAPILNGVSSAGLTTPASLPNPVAAPVPISPLALQPYACVLSP